MCLYLEAYWIDKISLQTQKRGKQMSLFTRTLSHSSIKLVIQTVMWNKGVLCFVLNVTLAMATYLAWFYMDANPSGNAYQFFVWYPFQYTVYPKRYAHGFCFAVLCCGYTLTDFPISIRLTSLALWQSNDCPSVSKATLMNIDKYFMWIHYERLHYHTKAKHNKPCAYFLGYTVNISVVDYVCLITLTWITGQRRVIIVRWRQEN